MQRKGKRKECEDILKKDLSKFEAYIWYFAITLSAYPNLLYFSNEEAGLIGVHLIVNGGGSSDLRVHK